MFVLVGEGEVVFEAITERVELSAIELEKCIAEQVPKHQTRREDKEQYQADLTQDMSDFMSLSFLHEVKVQCLRQIEN